MIVWFWSFILFVWCVTLSVFHMLNHTCIHGINPTWSVSVVCIFLGICPFHLGYLLSFVDIQLFIALLYSHFYFCKVDSNVSSIIPDFRNLSPLSLIFLVSLAKGLSVLLIYSKLFFSIIFHFLLNFHSNLYYFHWVALCLVFFILFLVS